MNRLVSDITPSPPDAYYAAVRVDLEADAQDLEAESWSLSVDQQCVKKHSKEMVKRQDVIYGEFGYRYFNNARINV